MDAGAGEVGGERRGAVTDLTEGGLKVGEGEAGGERCEVVADVATWDERGLEVGEGEAGGGANMLVI